MIPAVIRKIHYAKKQKQPTVEIWGDGEARREFMYAGDIAQVIWQYISFFEKMPDLMNIGLGHDYTINEYYATIAHVIGYEGAFTHNLLKPVGMRQKLIDVNLQKENGLIPKYDLESGIKETYKYFLTLNE